MTNFSIIENKITLIRKFLSILERYKPYSRNEIEDNVDVRGAVERYLYLAVQATIDTAEACIALRNFRKPTTQKEGFEILQENNVISIDIMHNMVKMAGFRNIMAHGYAKVDYDKVYDILQNKLGDIEEFIEAIKKALNLS